MIRDADGSERTVELRDGVMRIGRAAGNEIVIGDASKGVSRTHAELHIDGSRCTIVDLHSQNGTWVNALRVQRAEVRPDAEIAIGVFRLRLQGAPAVAATGRPAPRAQPATIIAPKPASVAGPPPPLPSPPPSPPPSMPAPQLSPRGTISDLPLMAAGQGVTSPVPMPAIPQPSAPQAAAVQKPKRSSLPFIYGGIGAVAMIALAVALFSIPQKPLGRPAAPGATPPAPAAAAPAAQAQPQPAAPASTTPPPALPVAPPAPTTDGAARSATRPASRPSTPPPPATPAARSSVPPAPAPPAATRSSQPPSASRGRASAATPSAAVRTTAENLPVPRKPGESLQDWQTRSSALQARYAFAKVALDRGDYSAAAGGFAAILLEEPGFLDTPQLLVKAREGLRSAAAEAIESGNKLDASGDWVNALKKYDQAREIDRAVPGLEEAIKRVRDKMRVAGTDALRRARQFDALGRFADALTEYEKAAQWLSPEDPNQQIARGRADQLKARQR